MKFVRKFYFGILVIILSMIYNYVDDNKLIDRYDYGINFNSKRIENKVPVLPDFFEYTKDDYYGNLIVWKNPNPKANNENYTHLRKMLTVRNSDILLEEDWFKMKKDSINFEVLETKFYYNEDGTKEKRFYIKKNYSGTVLVSVDTINFFELW